MARALHDPIATGVARRPFTVEEYYRMAEAGILSEDDRVELIAGEVIEMSPIGSLHAAIVDQLNVLCVSQVGSAAIVRVQNPVRLDNYSEPEPDISLLRPRADFYKHGHPGPADVLLIIEVADSSLLYDRKVKIPLYAEHGIPEVVLIDLANAIVIAHGDPANGTYRSRHELQRGASFVSSAVLGLTLAVDAILG